MSNAIESLIVEDKGEPEKVNREKVCPLLLRVFCNIGRHNNILEYTSKSLPVNELQIYTWLDASLREITSLVKEVNPDARRKGTIFDFALVVPVHGGGPPYRARDIGTTYCGQKGPDDTKTLSQVRFNTGDFMDISITPPNRMGVGSMSGAGNMGMAHSMRRNRIY